MLFANVSHAMISACKTFRRILAVRKWAEILVAHAIATTMDQHMAIEIFTSVSTWEGTAGYGTFEGFVVRFDVFARSLSQNSVEIKY